jgi:hypothetical protein
MDNPQETNGYEFISVGSSETIRYAPNYGTGEYIVQI